MNLPNFLLFTQSRLHENLKMIFSDKANKLSSQTPLFEAMQYTLLNGGKRVRPMLVYAAAIACQNQAQHVGEGELSDINKTYKPSLAEDCFANAIELMHCYSLVHDDLPAMDDDDLRRGQATCHIKFDEATAILAGDALQSLSFEQALLPCEIPYRNQLEALRFLAQASGMEGMVMGQAIDLSAVNTHLTLEELETMHLLKTGALIEASVRMGALSVSANGDQVQALTSYARAIGLAFQVQDDILDITSDTIVLGKAQGADLERNKPTYVSLLGLEGAQKKALQLRDTALAALATFNDEAQLLRELAYYIVERRS